MAQKITDLQWGAIGINIGIIHLRTVLYWANGIVIPKGQTWALNKENEGNWGRKWVGAGKNGVGDNLPCP